ncbi:MAG: hypothetical protein HZA53_12415 [Planctomycetes bacterium]|nr:hypothetical protein [Planctomycetota bacterium]
MFPALVALSLVLFQAGEDGLHATVAGRGGRVELVGGDGRVWIVNDGDLRGTRGRAHLELGAGAVAEVAWPGAASARFIGPCLVLWVRAALALAPRTDGERIVLRCFELHAAEIEVRSPRADIELAGGWRVGA